MIPTYTKSLPFLSTEQMMEVDRAMIEDYGIDLIQMMENAGRNLAHLARTRFLAGKPTDKTIVVLAGTGGNGGGALVCARRLHNYGAKVQVVTSKADDNFRSVPKHQLAILRRMNIPVINARATTGLDPLIALPAPDLIIDGLIGYSLKGAPRGEAAKLIRWANAATAPILALDTPSGIDTSTGSIFDPVIKAVATMTLALPKAGLRASGVEALVGELYLADISVPPKLYASAALGLAVTNIFAEADLVRLH